MILKSVVVVVVFAAAAAAAAAAVVLLLLLHKCDLFQMISQTKQTRASLL